MRRRRLTVILGSLLFLSVGAAVSAEPTNYPENPNACVGHSSSLANATFQDADPDKYRSDQARGLMDDLDQAGRADAVAVIPECDAAGLDRGHIAE